MVFQNDTIGEYSRQMQDTFQPPKYAEVWKQKYHARIHKVTEPMELYLLDKMRLFRASHNPYDFKRFLETGVQSICHPKLQKQVISQKYRCYNAMMKDISEVSIKWRVLHKAGFDPTGTLAGIMGPPLMKDSHEAWLNKTGQHKMEVNAVKQSVSEPWLVQPGKINAVGSCYNCQQPGHIRSQCPKGSLPVTTSNQLATVVRTTASKNCFRCEKTGHFAQDCRGAARGTQPLSMGQSKGLAKQCQYCKKRGHLVGECRSKKGHEGRVQQLENPSFHQED